MSKKVYMFLAWDNEDEKKIVFLCKTEKLAEELLVNYRNAIYEHAEIREMKIFESLDGAEGVLI